MQVKNEFVKFYKECGGVLDPKDIGDLKEHLYRRKRLYAMLGIPAFSFKGINVLDIGGGSGYNTLVFLLLGAKVDLVEPNENAAKMAQELFDKYKIPKAQYGIHNKILEDFKDSCRYDIIIAEGFLHSLYAENRAEVINKMKEFTQNGSYVVVTTMCEFSYFFEDLRRILGLVLTRDISEFSQKADILSQAFESHLKSLKFAVRPVKDWAIDTILNPGGDVKLFSIDECIGLFGTEYEVVGMSPNVYPNMSWYKDMEYSYALDIVSNFDSFRHLLLSVAFRDFIRDKEKNRNLLKQLIKFRECIKEYRDTKSDICVRKIVEIFKDIINTNGDLGGEFVASVKECMEAILCQETLSVERIAKMQNLKNAWGRGMQYISFKRL